nr:methylglyoxal synthase [uncultured Roseateles sp.]
MTAPTASVSQPDTATGVATTAAAPARLRIALIAHDGKKDEMVMLATEFAGFLGGCDLVATGTTGSRLTAEVGLTVERMLSGPHGGDLQIGARLAVGLVDAVVFLRDPMTPQPHEPDINALVRACDVHNVACATNVTSSRLMLRSLQVLGTGGGRE